MDAAAGTGAECATHAGLWNYARHFTYNAAGAVTSMQLGNGRWESTAFNSRLQPVQIALGSTGTGAQAHDLLKLDYGYGGANNNGNVLSQTITVKRPNQSDLVFDQLYTYDSLNRITSAEEKTGTTVNWNQTYTFDRYGNRNFNESLTTTLPKGCMDGSTAVVCEADKKMLDPALDPANNKMASGQGWSYDAAGNVITDPQGRSFIYDTENKQVEVENSLEQSIGKYWFDGDGKRIKKEGIAPNGQPELTVFVYDAAGKLIGEYSTNIETAAPKVQYLTADHLGSPRINTDQNGAVTSRTDYMPYGEEIIGLGGRSANEAYSTDDIRKGFTGYERDDETDLDFAQARYHDYGRGRFSSPDPIFFHQSMMIDPQRFNLYLYVRNNPLKYIDPFGLTLRISARGNYQEAMEDIRVLAGEFAEHLVFDAVKDDNGNVLYFNVTFNVVAADIVGNEGAQLIFDLVNDSNTFLTQRGGTVQRQLKGGKDKGRVTDVDVNKEGGGNITRNRPGPSGAYEPIDPDVDSVIFYSEGVVFVSNVSDEDVQPIRMLIHEASESLLLAQGVEYATAHGLYWDVQGTGKNARVVENRRDPRNAISREKTIAYQLNLRGGFGGWLRVSNESDLRRK